MPRKNCPYGFSCASLTNEPGLVAALCPNIESCSILAKNEGTDDIALQFIQDEKTQRETLTPEKAATLMLRQRGNPQSFYSLGISNLSSTLQELTEALQQKLEQLETAYENQFIAPEGTEVHAYAVKRPYGKYWYNKLSAYSQMFISQTEQGMVRHIHLSKDDDPRCLIAQQGIARRNQLTKIRTQLTAARNALEVAVQLIDEKSDAGFEETQ